MFNDTKRRERERDEIKHIADSVSRLGRGSLFPPDPLDVCTCGHSRKFHKEPFDKGCVVEVRTGDCPCDGFALSHRFWSGQ